MKRRGACWNELPRERNGCDGESDLRDHSFGPSSLAVVYCEMSSKIEVRSKDQVGDPAYLCAVD